MVTPASAGRRSFASRAIKGPVGLYGAPGNGPKPVTRRVVMRERKQWPCANVGVRVEGRKYLRCRPRESGGPVLCVLSMGCGVLDPGSRSLRSLGRDDSFLIPPPQGGRDKKASH